MERSGYVAIQVVAAALVILGTVSVAWGLQARSGYDCESGYVYDVDQVSTDEVDGPVVRYEDLDTVVREGFLRALGGGADPDPVSVLPPNHVRYRGDVYRVVAMAVDCAEPPGLAPTLVGAPMLALGLLVFLPVSVVLRTRDWEG